MLKKLLKYEIRATARTFLPLFTVLFLFTVINKFFFELNPNRFSVSQGVMLTLYIVTLTCIAAMTLIITIQRFYKNLLGDEGYLMFTLPVKPWQLICSKLLASGLWSAVSAVVAVLSIMVVAIDISNWRSVFEAAQFLAQEARAELGTPLLVLVGEVALVMLSMLAAGILAIYLSMALGHQFNSHRLLASFGAFLVVTTVVETITLLLGRLLVYLGMRGGFFMSWFEALDGVFRLHITLFCIIGYAVVGGAICFIGTNLFLEKRLNLE